MSFRIKTHSEQPNPPVPPHESRRTDTKEKKVEQSLPMLPEIPNALVFRYNEVPVERLLPSQERKDYVESVRVPVPENIVEKDIIVYDTYKEQWILVKESEAYKYKTM